MFQIVNGTIGFLNSFGLMQRMKKGWHRLRVFMRASKDFLNCAPSVGDFFLVSEPCKKEKHHQLYFITISKMSYAYQEITFIQSYFPYAMYVETSTAPCHTFTKHISNKYVAEPIFYPQYFSIQHYLLVHYFTTFNKNDFYKNQTNL